MVMVDLEAPATQAMVALVVGVSQQAISAQMADGRIPSQGTIGAVVQAYCQRLREQAAGRLGAMPGGLDPVQEAAALNRSKRIGQDLKNAVTRKEYGPVGLLADVLGTASSAVVDRFDHLEGVLSKACPDLPEEAKAAVFTVIADARNEWIKSTAKLVDAAVDAMVDTDEGDDMEVAA